MVNSNPDNGTTRLPLRKWLLLADAVALVAKVSGCSHEDAREFISHALEYEVARLRGIFDDEPIDRSYLEVISANRILNSKLDWKSCAIHFHEPYVLDPRSNWPYDEARDVKVEIKPILELISDHRGEPTASGSIAIDQVPFADREQGADRGVATRCGPQSQR